MTITRKLLIPTILILLAILLGTVVVVFRNDQIQNREQARKDMLGYLDEFEDRVVSSENFALALALDAANNPEIQAAFAQQDRERLLELTAPSYKALDREFDIPQYQFHLAPAISFLRLHQPKRYGDDLSSFRFTVVDANAEGVSVSGPEVGRGGLGVRGVTPVRYNGEQVGTVEFGLNIDKTLLNELKDKHGADWQIYLTTDVTSLVQFHDEASLPKLPGTNLLLQTNTLETPVDISADDFLQALNGETVILYPVETNELYFAALLAPLYDYSGNIIGSIAIYQDRTAERLAQRKLLARNILIISLVSLVVYGLLFMLITRTLSPINKLTKATSAVAEGRWVDIPDISTNDELGFLAGAISAMTQRLRNMIGGLEQSVQERTASLELQSQRLQAAADIGHAASAILETERLVRDIVQIIADRFELYYVGLFLADEDFNWAVLRAGAGDVGRAMLERKHKIKIGEGMIGWSIANGRVRIAENAGEDAVRLATAELPETRSEAAIPLRARGKVIGALTVQDNKADTFTPEVVAILQIVADQVGIALDNTQLFAEAQSALEASRRAYGQLSKDAWAEIIGKRTLGFRNDAHGTVPITAEHVSKADAENLPKLEIPISIQEQVIGTIVAHKKAESGAWNAAEINIMQALAKQINIALEGARLYEETQRRAAREQIASEVASRIRETLDMETILKTAVGEMQRALGLQEVEVRLTAADEKQTE